MPIIWEDLPVVSCFKLDVAILTYCDVGTAGADLIIQTITNQNGLRSGVGSYPLEGGYIYFTPAHSGNPGDVLYAYKFGHDSAGNPQFSPAGKSSVTFAGLSVPTVTSNNGQAGSGIVSSSSLLANTN